ncbi:hypothetical protein LPJ70_005787, partial [Coemansia sp. RSA 2708]
NPQVHDQPPAAAQADGHRRAAPGSGQPEQDRGAREALQDVQVRVRPGLPLRLPHPVWRRPLDRLCADLRLHGRCQEVRAQIPSGAPGSGRGQACRAQAAQGAQEPQQEVPRYREAQEQAGRQEEQL